MVLVLEYTVIYRLSCLVTNKQCYCLNAIKKKFNGRNELKRFDEQVHWCVNEGELLSLCNLLIIAQMPDCQEKWLKEALKEKQLEFILLEKPLAASPESSELLLEMLSRSDKSFRIMYSFLYLEWFQKLKKTIDQASTYTVEILWHFKAHHFSNELLTWKRFHSQGGGVIRFYGIHLIAVLSSLGINNVVSSAVKKYDADVPYEWNAVFAGNKEKQITVSVDSDSDKKEFSVIVRNKNEVILEIKEHDPFFECTRNDDLDNRVELNKKIHTSLLLDIDSEQTINLYKEINSLWKSTEEAIC